MMRHGFFSSFFPFPNIPPLSSRFNPFCELTQYKKYLLAKIKDKKKGTGIRKREIRRPTSSKRSARRRRLAASLAQAGGQCNLASLVSAQKSMPLCDDENGAILVGDENNKNVGTDDNVDDDNAAANENNENVSDISRLKWTFFFFADYSQNDYNEQVDEEQVDEEKAGAEQAGDEQAEQALGEAQGESERAGGEQADDQQVEGQASDAA